MAHITPLSKRKFTESSGTDKFNYSQYRTSHAEHSFPKVSGGDAKWLVIAGTVLLFLCWVFH